MRAFFLLYVRPHLCFALHQPIETFVGDAIIKPRFQVVFSTVVGAPQIDDALCRFELAETNMAPEVVEVL